MMLWEVSKGMNIRFLVIPIFILFNLAETTSTFQSDMSCVMCIVEAEEKQ